VPNPAFMVRELEPGALLGLRGQVVYHAAFEGL
jgi:predicted N-acetyltransferase YhbS